MRKVLFCAGILLLCVLIPSISFTEDSTAVRLARTIYALAGSDSYEAKLAIGTVAANRADNPWFGSSLLEVLAEQHQFPCGTRYDSESLRAAHAILSGTRALPSSVLYYQAADASDPWDSAGLQTTIGNYRFYTEK